MSYRQIILGESEPVKVYVVSVSGDPLTGKTDIFLRIQRGSDNWFLDWDDNTFKETAHTALDTVLTEVDITNAPGLYELVGGFDSSVVTNLAEEDDLTVIPVQTPKTDARLPTPAELQVRVDRVQAQVDKIDLAPTLGPSSVESGSLVDRTMNKNANKTYNQATDSLEALRDRYG